MVLKASQIITELLDAMPAWRCDEAHDTDVTQRRLEFSIVSTARRCGDVGVNMRADGSIYFLSFEPIFGFG